MKSIEELNIACLNRFVHTCVRKRIEFLRVSRLPNQDWFENNEVSSRPIAVRAYYYWEAISFQNATVKLRYQRDGDEIFLIPWYMCTIKD